MAPGPERPDAAKGDQRSPVALDLRWGIRVARSPAEQCGHDAIIVTRSPHQAADVAKIVDARPHSLAHLEPLNLSAVTKASDWR
jgi:hypothetical protein